MNNTDLPNINSYLLSYAIKNFLSEITYPSILVIVECKKLDYQFEFDENSTVLSLQGEISYSFHSESPNIFTKWTCEDPTVTKTEDGSGIILFWEDLNLATDPETTETILFLYHKVQINEKIILLKSNIELPFKFKKGFSITIH